VDIRVVTERHILSSALAATLKGIARVTLLPDSASPEGNILVLEMRGWNAERVDEAVRQTVRPVIAWIPVMAASVVRRAVQSGVRGVLCDMNTAEEILNCVTVVARGEVWLPSDVSAAMLTRRVGRLSLRESELVDLVSTGLRNKEIANRMNITEGTVKVYLSRVFDKLGVADRLELAILVLHGEVGRSTPPRHSGPATGSPRTLPVESGRFRQLSPRLRQAAGHEAIDIVGVHEEPGLVCVRCGG
jgi:DNA-binding NarL/FixJ family response regulator